MLKISDFSKLSFVSIKALRLYDQMNLLKPAHVDRFTGYRYYSAEQLPRLNRILALKDLGFSLEEICQLLDEISIDRIHVMLQLKQIELQRTIAAEQERLARIEARIKQIEQEQKMSDYEVILRSVEVIHVASIREVLPNYPSIGKLFDKLQDYLQKYRIKSSYCAAIWHDRGYKENDVDAEAVIAVPSNAPAVKPVRVYNLSAVEMACFVHHGSYQTLSSAYEVLLKWIETNGYQISAANREVYIHGGFDQTNEDYVTELQFPVIRNAKALSLLTLFFVLVLETAWC